MDSKLMFILEISIILFAANIGGFLSRKLKQPAVLGQIISGVILGLFLFEKTPMIESLGEIGVIFLMFVAGLETDVNELKASSKSSSLIAMGGVIMPLILVGAGAYVLTGSINESLFMGVIATATSVSISVQTLRELGRLRTPEGIGILGAAIIDDVVGIVLLTLIIGVVKPEYGSSLFMVIGKIFIFFIFAFIVGTLIVKFASKFCEKLRIEDHIVSFSIITCLILAFLSEELGVAAITGAYFAGVIFSMTTFRNKISHDVSMAGNMMFTPIFFVSIGMGVDLHVVGSALVLGMLFITMGIVGKVIGCGVGARLSGFSKESSLQIGIGMVPRAEVAIIIANLGVKVGIMDDKGLAAVISMVLVTTLITPSLLKWATDRVDVVKA